MEINDGQNQLKNLITESSKIALCLPKTVNPDILGSATGLAGILTNLNKEVTILYCGDQAQVAEFTDFATIQDKFGEYSLTVNLDYNNTPIEKVSYVAENGVFKMVVSPIDKNFDLSKIGYEFTGPAYNLIIVIGAQKLTDLGEIYLNNEAEFKKLPLINMDTNSANEKFGTTNIVEETAPNLVSLVLAKMSVIGYFPSNNSIKAFLLGISRNNSLTTSPPIA